MAELMLDRDARLALRARAHSIEPVVLLGAAGLSAAVLAEIDRALASHELIKVRVPAAERDVREAIFAEIADRIGAARVQAIGKLVVLYRPLPEEPRANPESRSTSGASGPKSPSGTRPGARSSATRGAGDRRAGSRTVGASATGRPRGRQT